MSPSPDLGLSCRLGGEFYVCSNSTTRFIGCCLHDPCPIELTPSEPDSNGPGPTSGHCSPGDLRPASFAASAYDAIPPQGCAASPNHKDVSASSWYTCARTKIPFLGCCAANPCLSTIPAACLQADIIPAVLSDNATNAAVFLGTEAADSGGGQSPAGSGDGHNGTDHNGTAGGDQQGGRNYLPMQLGIGITALIVILVVIGGTVYWQRRQKRKNHKGGLDNESQGQESPTAGLELVTKPKPPVSSPKLLYNRYSQLEVSHDIGAFDNPRPAPKPPGPPSPLTLSARTHPQPYTGPASIGDMAKWTLRSDR